MAYRDLIYLTRFLSIKGEDLGKAIIVTPLYVSVAWTLMISYQLFTQTAVTTVVTYLGAFLPSISNWLFSRLEMLVFIYAFAWVFVLSSVIPSHILGRERSVIIQFLVCLMLTLSTFVIQDMFETYGGKPIEHIFSVATLLNNPFLATIYLSAPYIFMLMLDLRSRKTRKKNGGLENWKRSSSKCFDKKGRYRVPVD